MHSVTLGQHWNPFSARAPLPIPLGELTTLPDSVVGWGGGNPFPIPTHRCFQRLRLGALEARTSCLRRQPSPPNPRPLAVPSGSVPVSSCPFSEPKMHQNAWFCIINVFFGSPNSRGRAGELPPRDHVKTPSWK